MIILIINAGSSSIKFELFRQDFSLKLEVVTRGIAERILFSKGNLIFYKNKQKHLKIINEPNHKKVILEILKLLETDFSISQDKITAIGHRIVHGGDLFIKPLIADQKILRILMTKFNNFAPLHNPVETEVVKICQDLFKIPNILTFDTSYHSTLEEQQYLYALPFALYEKEKIRKYGFHGLSYQYVVSKLLILTKKKKINTIVCHLGNGSSIAAVKANKSFNTTMGFTPLQGLIMGTRCGDIDPAIIEYLMVNLKLPIQEVMTILNKKSGLYGISNFSSDFRDLENALKDKDKTKQKKALLAIEMYAQRIADYIVTYYNQLEKKVDCIVFTAGIGENSSLLRKKVCQKLNIFNIILDENINNNNSGDRLITKPNSEIKVFVIKTNEELLICQETIKLINKN